MKMCCKHIKTYLFALVLLSTYSHYSYSKGANVSDCLIRVLIQKKRDVLKAEKKLSAYRIFQKYQGRSITFDNAVDIVAQQLPSSEASKFLKEAKSFFQKSKVKIIETSKVSVGKSKISYRSRFLDPNSVSRSDNAKIMWSNQKVKTVDDIHKAIENFIDIYTEAKFIPVRKISILKRKPSTFIAKNIQTMTDKLLLKLYTTNGTMSLTKLDEAASVVKTSMSSSLLPTHFSNIRGLKLNKIHLEKL